VQERKSTRLVARLGDGQEWFPHGISEVVAHSDGHFVAVNIAHLVRGRPAVLMREFRCADADACRAEMAAWLRVLAAQSDADESATRVWSERVAGLVTEGLVAR